MKKDSGLTKILKTSPALRGFTEAEIDIFIEKIPAYIRKFQRKEEIYTFDEKILHAGIVVAGEVDIEQSMTGGNAELVTRIMTGGMIGCGFNIVGARNDVAHFVAASPCSVLFMDFGEISGCGLPPQLYLKFQENLIRILAERCIFLNRKIEVLAQRSLRDKLMTYFNQLQESAGSRTFTLDFNRDQLAQYICSERSSVCRELGHMQDDGLISMCGRMVTMV